MTPRDANIAEESSVEVQGSSPQSSFRFGLRHLLGAVALIGVALAIMIAMYRSARDEAEQARCDGNLKMIGLALQNYHDTFRSFPAAWQVDGSGKIAHSWRVAILPFIWANADLDHYNHSEPWNSPHNSKIATRTGFRLYTCPADRHHQPEMTNYVAVVGPGTAWPGTAYGTYKDLTGRLSASILVVEITNSDIHWMEPRDLPVEELNDWLKPGHKPTLLLSHSRKRIRGGIVVFADCHTEFLPHDQAEARLREMLKEAASDNVRSANESK